MGFLQRLLRSSLGFLGFWSVIVLGLMLTSGDALENFFTEILLNKKTIVQFNETNDSLDKNNNEEDENIIIKTVEPIHPISYFYIYENGQYIAVPVEEVNSNEQRKI